MDTTHLVPAAVLEHRYDAENVSFLQPSVVLEHDASKDYVSFLQPLVVLEEAPPPPPFRVGDVLGYRDDTWSGSPTGFSVQWTRNGVPIAGATGPTYAVVSDDLGATISVEVTATNAAGSSAPASSEFTMPIEGAA